MSLNEIVVILGTLIGAIAAGYVQQRKQRKQVTAEIDAHKETVAVQAQKQTATLQEELSRKWTAELELTRNELTAEVETLKQDNHSMADKINALRTDLIAERARNTDLKAELEAKNLDIDLLQKEVRSLREAVDALKAERSDAVLALEKETERSRAMEQRILALEHDLATLHEKNIRLEAQLDAYEKVVVPLIDKLAFVATLTPPTVDPIPLVAAA